MLYPMPDAVCFTMHRGWGRTEDKHVEAAAEGPKVGQAGVVGLAAAHLWSHEGRRAGRAVHQVAAFRELGAAKVRDLDVAVRAHQQVVRLQVPMGDLVCVQVVKALQQLRVSGINRLSSQPRQQPLHYSCVSCEPR